MLCHSGRCGSTNAMAPFILQLHVHLKVSTAEPVCDWSAAGIIGDRVPEWPGDVSLTAARMLFNTYFFSLNRNI